jgi:glycosyltransferase involved in cell wall biosynthesis
MAIALNMACRRLAAIDASPLILLPGVAKGLAQAAPQPAPSVSDRASRRGAPRIVLLQTQAENAGAQEVSRILGQELAAKGYDVHPVFLFRRTGGFDAEPNVVYCASRRPSSPFALAALLWRLFRTLRRLKPDAVLCFQHYGNVIGAPIARLAGVPRVVINQNSAPLTTPGLARRLDRWIGSLGVADRIVVNSGDTQSDYAAYPRSYAERIVRIDHGFEVKASRMTQAEARAAFGLSLEGPLLGCVSRLHPLKHLDASIRLLLLEPSWHLALAGQGAAEADLRALAASLGCTERVHFVGELTPRQVGDFLAALDVFVFPSVAETFGLAAVEAAAAGVPVVANGLPVLHEVLAADGQPCALFVDVDDAPVFAAAVRGVLEDRALARELSQRGRRLADRYPASAMADGYDALLRQVVSPPRLGRAL